MNKTLYDWYAHSRQALAKYELEQQIYEPHEMDPQIDEMVKGWQEAITMIDQNTPQVKNWYERKKEIQKTFTPEQVNFICEQIGDWYLMMKPLLEGQHNLGYMKERLKIMICGD